MCDASAMACWTEARASVGAGVGDCAALATGVAAAGQRPSLGGEGIRGAEGGAEGGAAYLVWLRSLLVYLLWIY